MSKMERLLTEENERLRTLCAQLTAERDALVQQYDPGPTEPTWRDLQPRDIDLSGTHPLINTFGQCETEEVVAAIVALCVDHHPDQWGEWSVKFIQTKCRFGEITDSVLKYDAYPWVEESGSARFGTTYGLNEGARRRLFEQPLHLAKLKARREAEYKQGRVR